MIGLLIMNTLLNLFISYKNTHNSIITVHIVSASMAASGCQEVWELLLGSIIIVHLDGGQVGDTDIPASSHHHTVF